MKWYVADYNGILFDLKTKLADKLVTPRDADVWVTWQDAQGSYADLFKAARALGQNKPLYVVQHGRSATLDYAPPNSFPLYADKFLCWGTSDKARLDSLGYGDRAVVVGCPLNAHIKPRVEHKEKVVLFVPVNTGKEEPENIAAYYELMKLKYGKAQLKVLENKGPLKDKWSVNDKMNVPFNFLAQNFDVAAKLLPWHDKNLYHGNTVIGYQDVMQNNQLVFSLLRNVDMVVGLDEGTTEIFAYGHDVPVVIVDGFTYRQHKPNGRDWVEQDIYRTNAATHVKLENLAEAIEYGLAHPEHKRYERAVVAESELGLSYGNATENIHKFIKEDMRAYAR
jgi:hypothetical protein